MILSLSVHISNTKSRWVSVHPLLLYRYPHRTISVPASVGFAELLCGTARDILGHPASARRLPLFRDKSDQNTFREQRRPH